LIELRLKSTSQGLEKSIQRTHPPPHIAEASLTTQYTELHLLTYHQRHLAYLAAITSKGKITDFFKVFAPFSSPYDPQGYNDTSINHGQITEVYKHFVANSCQVESECHLRSITGALRHVYSSVTFIF
jgi:hypothetical protein